MLAVAWMVCLRRVATNSKADLRLAAMSSEFPSSSASTALKLTVFRTASRHIGIHSFKMISLLFVVFMLQVAIHLINTFGVTVINTLVRGSRMK